MGMRDHCEMGWQIRCNGAGYSDPSHMACSFPKKPVHKSNRCHVGKMQFSRVGCDVLHKSNIRQPRVVNLLKADSAL